MNSEIIVMVLADSNAQDEAKRLIEPSHGGSISKLVEVVSIHQSSDGTISYQAIVEPSQSHDCLALAFAEVIFEPSRQDDRLQLASEGLDRFFLKTLNDVLAPNSLIYLFYIAHDRLIDSRDILEYLGELQGNLCHTMFRPHVEEVLSKQIH